MPDKSIFVRVPASTANLGPGFDTLGMALELYAWIEMKPSDTTKIHLHGSQLKGIPTDKSNLIYQMAELIFRKARQPIPELEISMYSDIPLTRGLGSSASAIVGAMAAANQLLEKPFSQTELLQLSTEVEDHPDNVGASLYGGIVVASWYEGQVRLLQIEPDSRLEVLVAIPEFLLETKRAREVLPERITIKDAVFNVGHASLLVGALLSGQLEMIRFAMRDRLHQPYRASLIPGMSTILEQAADHGALGAALSGAGPTLLAFVDREQSEAKKRGFEQFLTKTLSKEGIKSQLLWLEPDRKGVQVLTETVQHSTFIDKVNQERNGHGAL